MSEDPPAPPPTLEKLLSEGYRAFVLQQADREKVTAWAKAALEGSKDLRIEASRELARLDELARKTGKLEQRCFISAKNLTFLKLILGSA